MRRNWRPKKDQYPTDMPPAERKNSVTPEPLCTIARLCTVRVRVGMASSYSFDIVSKFDYQEMRNAIDQAQREIQQRYDLKDTGTVIELTEKDITINTATEYSLQA